MSTGNYKEEIKFIEDTLIRAMRTLKSINVYAIHDKAERDLVTNCDYAVENSIIDSIRAAFPDDQILSEESNPTTVINHRTWILDPIDGTCNFANKIPLYGIQLALTEDKKVIASGIALPCLNELYLAVIHKGCTLNGRKLKVHASKICHSIVSFGDFNDLKPAESDLQSQTMFRLRHQIMKEKMFGAASIDFAFLASGRISGIYLIASHAWDILPGLLICKEAGCLISDEDGQPYQFDSNIVLAANSQKLLDLMGRKAEQC